VPLRYLILVLSLWENGDFNNGVSCWYEPAYGAEQRFPTLGSMRSVLIIFMWEAGPNPMVLKCHWSVPEVPETLTMLADRSTQDNDYSD